jgi:hypothetical protein
MADDPVFSAETQPTLQQLIDYFVEALHDPEKVKRWEAAITNGNAKAGALLNGLAAATLDPLLEVLAKVFFSLEEHVETVAGPPLARLAGHLIGRDVSIADLRRAANSDGESVVGNAVAKLALDALRAPDGELQPGAERATKFLAVLGQLIVNGWFETTAFELITTLVPDMDSFESVAELPHELVDALGLGRLARVALRPLAQIGVATPLEWQLHKAHRPTMLGTSDIVDALMRGDYTPDDAAEELARAGYSDKRIATIIAGKRKTLSVGDARVMVRENGWSRNQVIEQLRGAGYDADAAELQLRAVESRELAAIHDDSYAAVRGAYVDRRISDAEFENFLPAIFPDDELRGAHEVAARTMRDVNTKRMSAGQVEACVKAGVLAVIDYRAALQREGYPPDDVIALELLLETELKADADVAALRKQKTADAAADAKAKADALAAKKADADAAAKLKRRGPLSELERAAVRGLIPLSRVQEVLSADYDADTVAIFVADITQQRAAYVAQQQKADDAAKRAENKGLSLSQLEQGVLAGALTVDQYRRELARFDLAPADQDVLVATLTAKKADADAATRKRADAERRATANRISLPTFEQLVRAGIRPMSDYDALLGTLGYDDADRASLVALLQSKIDADAAAKALRDATAAANAARGLSLEQERRAVILGTLTLDDFQTWLVDQKYSVDAQVVLVDELRDDVAQANAARQRRQAADAIGGASGLPLSTIARAARLGIITPARYQATLVARGYSPDDVAIELNLLANEIRDVNTAADVQATADADVPASQLTLAQLAAGVKAGQASLAFYRSTAITRGLSDDDANLLTRVLGDELAATQAAKSRRAALASDVKPGDVPIAVLEQRVRDGALSLDDYGATLVSAGLAPIDVDLLVSLLADEGGARAS